MVRSLEEVSSRIRARAEMDGFNDFISEWGLIDLPMRGATFTFSNLQRDTSLSRLDRALVSMDWEDFYFECNLRAFERTCSDHCPLLLDCAPVRGWRRPWKFELMWLQAIDFQEVAGSCWRGGGVWAFSEEEVWNVIKSCSSDKSPGPDGWLVWRDIVKLNPMFWKYAFIDPGGGGVSFWFDSWVQGECLALRFPRVAAVALSVDASLSSSVLLGDRYEWVVPLMTVLRGGAEEERSRMMLALEGVAPGWIAQGPPTPVVRGVDDFPFRTVWIGEVPTKVAGFIWQ
ncbi:hypothetical protein LINPERHAP2_LOCUS26210, partial [Linum perenne]